MADVYSESEGWGYDAPTTDVDSDFEKFMEEEFLTPNDDQPSVYHSCSESDEELKVVARPPINRRKYADRYSRLAEKFMQSKNKPT